MKKLRVPLPSFESTELLLLAKSILAKHILDGNQSVLDHVDWEAFKAAMEKADLYFHQAEELRMQSAQRIIDRNMQLEEVLTGVRCIRDILTGLNIKNMKNLGNWGFEVIEATAPSAKAKTKAKQGKPEPETTIKV